MDRTERLSFFSDGKITSLAQIKEKIVTQVIMQPGFMVIAYNDGTNLSINRGGAGGTSTFITSAGVSGPNNTLTIVDSKGTIYELGELSQDVSYDGLASSGVLVGKENGIPIFKPLNFSNQFVQDAGVISLPSAFRRNALMVSKRMHVRNGSEGGRSHPAGSWFSRVIDTVVVNEIPGASLGAGSVINLPQGFYFIKTMTNVHRGGHYTSRLVGGGSNVYLVSGSGFGRTSYTEDWPCIGMAFITIPSGGDGLFLQTICQTSTTNAAFSANSVEIWKIEQ